MAYVHEFRILEDVEENKEYTFETNKYPCTIIDGDLFDELYHKGLGNKLEQLETCWHNTNRPSKDLAYYGITLIPPQSLELFLAIMTEEYEKYKVGDLKVLVELIIQAIKKNKWVIHYGV